MPSILMYLTYMYLMYLSTSASSSASIDTPRRIPSPAYMHTYLKTHTLVQPHPHQSILHQALITPHNSTHLKEPDPILPLFPFPLPRPRKKLLVPPHPYSLNCPSESDDEFP